MSYAVKEIFYTLQGEGRQAGRAAVFCRFAGCNLWSGREADRASSPCTFCDTDFVGLDGPGGGRFADAEALADAVATAWAGAPDRRLTVLTGGEPLLQVDPALVEALHAPRLRESRSRPTALSQPRPASTGSASAPRASVPLALLEGDELKLVFPQPAAMPERFERLAFSHFILQPMDGPDQAANTAAAVRYCMAHPHWRLGLQTHKVLGIA